MQSLVRSNRLLCHVFGKSYVKQWKRCIRFEPLVIDKRPDYYPTIEQQLKAINYYETATNLVDIGFDRQSSDVGLKWSQVAEEVENSRQTKPQTEELDEEELIQSIDYKSVYEKWIVSEKGIQSIIDCANHYSIFKDLFPQKYQIETIPPKQQKTPKPVHYFNPLVPIKAEFCVLESEVSDQNDNVNDGNTEKSKEDSNQIIVSKSFRGNILLPEKCINCPNITIDSSAINGINNSDINNETEELAEEEISGKIRLLNDDTNYYTLCLINLDSNFGEESNVCHWMASNIHNQKGVTTYDTIFQYLPVYGIRGLGYHRYVFLLYQHKNLLNLEKINDFDLKKRKFNAYEFMSAHGSDNGLTPIGLSWFQTTWDYSSQNIFWNYLNMRSPHYEWIPPKNKSLKQLQFPGRAPFNIYLDQFRDPKEIAKQVLLERLKSINPLDYEKMFDKSPVPPQIHAIPIGTPDWLKASIRKRRAKVGNYRSLRPHSVIEPLDNNADLDRPTWPRLHESVHPLNQPIPYPDGHRRPKPLRETLWVKPPHEHPRYRIEKELTLEEEDKQKLRNSE